MTQEMMKRIFEETNYVHRSGTPEELRVAEYLKARCEELGVPARIEAFPVAMGEMEEARVLADGREIPCKGFFCCGSGSVEGELYYMPALDPVSVAGAKDKIVLLDGSGVGFFGYQDLMKAGAKGLLFQYGNIHYPIDDIDERDLRAAVVGEQRKVLCAMLHTADAVDLLRNGVKRVSITIRQREWEGESHNVVAELPGKREEYITLSAHYDTTALSHGSYDNMSGCVGLLGVLDALKDKALNYGLRFVFCGSEERGLLGSKAFVRDHEAELEKIPLNINLDMIGTWLVHLQGLRRGEAGELSEIYGRGAGLPGGGKDRRLLQRLHPLCRQGRSRPELCPDCRSQRGPHPLPLRPAGGPVHGPDGEGYRLHHRIHPPHGQFRRLPRGPRDPREGQDRAGRVSVPEAPPVRAGVPDGPPFPACSAGNLPARPPARTRHQASGDGDADSSLRSE